MESTNTEKVLNEFADYVIQQSKKRLIKDKQNNTSQLYNSLKYTPAEKTNDGLKVVLEMAYYGQFQDKGVRGVGGVRKTTSKFNSRNNKGKLWKQKGGNSPFSFKEGNKPSVKHFIEWSKSKGLSPYAVREAVYHQGFKATQFFSKSLNEGFENLPKELQEAFVIDVKNVIAQKNKIWQD